MNSSILITVKDTKSCRHAIEFLSRLPLCAEDVKITLLHVLRLSSSGGVPVDDDVAREKKTRAMSTLQVVKNILVENNFMPDKVETALYTEPCLSIAEGIINSVIAENYDMVVIGRRKKSKAEEFVLGDVSVKFVRAIEGVAVLVVPYQ